MRYVPIIGYINQEMELTVAEQLMSYYIEDSQHKDEAHEPIYIIINSCGGDVNAGISIFNLINMQLADTIGIVTGTAYSFAFFVLLACTTREITRYSKVMAHEVMVDIPIESNVTEMKEIITDLSECNRMFADIMRLKGLPKSLVKKIFSSKEDYFFKTSELVENGIAILKNYDD